MNRLKSPTLDITCSYRTYGDADIPALLEEWTRLHHRHWPRWLYDDECTTAATVAECDMLLKQMVHGVSVILDSDEDEVPSLPSDPCIRTALMRLRFGELVEEDVCSRWSSEHDEEQRLRYASISLAAAVWTSTHAEYLMSQSAERSYLHRATIHLVPSEYTDPQLSEFLTNAASIHDCGSGAKRTHLIYQLLHRAENTATRGWTSSSSQLLQSKGANGAGLRDIVMQAALVALTGLHSCIDPPARVHWRDRLCIHHIFRRHLITVDMIKTTPILVKQVVRRLLLSTYSGNEAARIVHNERRQTEGAFACPPFKSAPRRCRHVMSNVTQEAANVRSHMDVDTFMQTIEGSIDISNQRISIGPSEWPWNGKAGVLRTSVALKPIALSMFMQAHTANFTPLWKMCHQRHVRMTRLDAAQYDAFCEMNQMVEITRNQQRAVKMAMSRPYGHNVTLDQAFKLFGDKHITVSSGTYKQLLQETPVETLASILAFSRASAYLEHKQEYDYSSDIRAQQGMAVYERYIGSTQGLDMETVQTALGRLPKHACHLCICTECHRITNAHSASTDTTPFNEVGIASCIACANDIENVRCAKRISAAIRTALVSEQYATEHALDNNEHDLDHEFEQSMNTTLTRAEAGHLRRDSRRTYDQPRESIPCGKNQLLCIPLVGKVVRIYNTWFTLCCYCGNLISDVNASTNVNGYPACMRCSELKVVKKSKKKETALSDQICRLCRYRKRDLVAYCSPFDDQFENKNVPPELRVTFWCSKHRPPWLKEALLSGCDDESKILPMSEILARIGRHIAPRHS